MTEHTTTTDDEAQQEAPEAAQDAATSPESTPTPPEAAEPAQEPDGRSTEAAKYRTRLRAAEAELADAHAHIAELQGEVIRQLLAGVLADPSDFDQIGVPAVLGDDGRIDKEKLDAAIATLLEQKPHYAPQKTRPAMRPQPRAGAVADTGTRPAPQSKLGKAFPGGTTRWSEVIGKGERGAATEARSGRVRSEVSKTQDL